ncbi:hypothetical protein ED733_007283 [Metarhizium rileyi]|uniref:Oxidoreductase-like domain-containing protein n=1 Tax=Metarhizium rileyi (strain RCEF 4871) TaxID=1649241 RepID=A0A5C6GIL7_METRR|nr:hypothetical protein ED733_007283 [Metarhizium rileyi]
MSAPTRTAASRLRLVPRIARHFSTSTISSKDEQWPQRTPLGDYYTSILHDPIPYPFSHKPEEPPSTADPSVLPPHKRPKMPATKPKSKAQSVAAGAPSSPPELEPAPPPQTAQDRARIIFGSRLLGPAEQRDKLALRRAKSTYVAGVLVPPRPEEPDNCCMSGCVNCVWDQFREDMEEWSAKKMEAQRRLKTGSGTMDADGGGSETNWDVPSVGNDKIAKDFWDEEVYRSVPVGIREFMKQEKRLKERHAREGTVGG